MWNNIKGIFAIFIVFALVKSWLWPDKPDATLAGSTAASTVTAKDLPYPEVGIPGHVAPEGKTMHLNYRKNEPPVAIHCKEVLGEIKCKSAK